MLASFVLDGLEPIGQGQISYGVTGHGYHSNGNRLKPYRKKLAKAAAEAAPDLVPLAQGCTVALIFEMPRPKKPKYDVPAKPDVDHLVRAALDALQGVWFIDDKLVTRVVAEKVFAVPGSLGRTVGGLWDGRVTGIDGALDGLTVGT
jgi:Holliday junction resolvase RusA-like endonuclease